VSDQLELFAASGLVRPAMEPEDIIGLTDDPAGVEGGS
jgi:hypothetical protein